MKAWAWFKGTSNPWVWKRALQRQGESPYMVRRQILVTRWLTIYLNTILQPDGDTRLHTHPWKRAYSLKIRGTYWERLPHDVRVPGRWSRIPACHRIIALLGGPVVTLFIGLGKPGTWGFVNPDGTLTPGPSSEGRDE